MKKRTKNLWQRTCSVSYQMHGLHLILNMDSVRVIKTQCLFGGVKWVHINVEAYWL